MGVVVLDSVGVGVGVRWGVVVVVVRCAWVGHKGGKEEKGEEKQTHKEEEEVEEKKGLMELRRLRNRNFNKQ